MLQCVIDLKIAPALSAHNASLLTYLSHLITLGVISIDGCKLSTLQGAFAISRQPRSPRCFVLVQQTACVITQQPLLRTQYDEPNAAITVSNAYTRRSAGCARMMLDDIHTTYFMAWFVQHDTSSVLASARSQHRLLLFKH